MDPLRVYSLPFQGLKVGEHRFEYTLEGEFFQHFPGSPIGESQIEVGLLLDKRSDMVLLEFAIDGWMLAECDRCTAQIKLPVAGSRVLVVKYGEQEGEIEDEVVFIPRDISEFNVAPYLYEFSVLSMPMTNTYDCENDPEPPCNFEILKYLKSEDEDNPGESPWDSLKGFLPNNN